ncbi:MAG TPA: hypothetical protein VLH38_06075 [Patescibacteria group bacterium]|nr:hypothetical protein [Patescibacteria group bacterium]
MKLLLKIRLSWFFFGFFALYLSLSFIFKGTTFTSGSLTLFSVNSFLYGFYISPVLLSQKTRIDDLSKAIRAEANALFDILLKTKKLPKRSRSILQDLIEDYIAASFRERKPAEGEDEYERIIGYCLAYDGVAPEIIDKITTTLVTNQQNRSQLAMQLRNKVYSNEWWIMIVLFSITLGFVLFINVAHDNLALHLVKALLCTGLSMLMISLLKLSTLSHKKAMRIWDPLDTLQTSRFRRID